MAAIPKIKQWTCPLVKLPNFTHSRNDLNNRPELRWSCHVTCHKTSQDSFEYKHNIFIKFSRLLDSPEYQFGFQMVGLVTRL